MDKKALRAEMRAMLVSLDEAYLAESGEGIAETLFSMPEYASAKRIFAYISVGREIPTERIISRSVGLGKRVYTPISHAGGEMDFADISAGLHPGMYGIPEPVATAEVALPGEGDLIVVPALCCGADGTRLGQGGGYYDRYLAKNHDAVSVCVCRERMLRESIPTEWNDIRPDYVITEARIIKKRQG